MTKLSLYSGRTIDVLAWRGGQPEGDVLLNQSLADADSTGEICTGVQKLAQRFLIELLTEAGSVKYNPDRGTPFMTNLRLGSIRDDLTLRAEFSLSEAQARANLQAEESDDDPDDERYLVATVSGISVTPGFVRLSIQLSSRAKTVTFILPIPIVI